MIVGLRPSDADTFDGDADFPDLHAGQAFKLVAHRLDNGFADFGNGNAVFDKIGRAHV